MPKDPRTYKRRKRKSGKSKSQQTNLTESPGSLTPPESSTIIQLLSEMPFVNNVKNEEPVTPKWYPDTRFPHSTTLFPAGRNDCISQEPRIVGETFKRTAEDNFLLQTTKKIKVMDSTMLNETFPDDNCMVFKDSSKKVNATDSFETEDTFSDDCIIIEESPSKIKVEVIDLTDESKPIAPVECTPVKTTFLRTTKPNLNNKMNGDTRGKVELHEKTPGICADADMNNDIQKKSKESKASRHAETTHNIFLTSELDIENRVNRGANGQVIVTNTVSVSVIPNATDCTLYGKNISNVIPLKVEQYENGYVNADSASVSKPTSDDQTGINFANCPRSMQNKNKRSYEVVDNCMAAPHSSFIYRSDSKIPLVAPNVLQSAKIAKDIDDQLLVSRSFGNQQLTKEKVTNLLENCSSNSEKALENVGFDKDKNGTDLSNSVITAVQIKKEAINVSRSLSKQSNKETDKDQLLVSCSSNKEKVQANVGYDSLLTAVFEKKQAENLPESTTESLKDWLVSCSSNRGKSEKNLNCGGDKNGTNSSKSVLTALQVKMEAENLSRSLKETSPKKRDKGQLTGCSSNKKKAKENVGCNSVLTVAQIKQEFENISRSLKEASTKEKDKDQLTDCLNNKEKPQANVGCDSVLNAVQVKQEVENLPQSVNKQPNEENDKDQLVSCSSNSKKSNLGCDNDKNDTELSHSLLLTAVKMKEEPKNTDCQETSFNSDETVLNEDLLLEKSNTCEISSEILSSNELNRLTTSPNHPIGSVLLLTEQEKFNETFLKYLNINPINLVDVSKTLLYLNHMLKVKLKAVGDNRLGKRSETSNNLQVGKETFNNGQMEKQSSNNQPMEVASDNMPLEKDKINIGALLSNDVLRKILSTTNTAKPIQ